MSQSNHKGSQSSGFVLVPDNAEDCARKDVKPKPKPNKDITNKTLITDRSWFGLTTTATGAGDLQGAGRSLTSQKGRVESCL